MENSEFPTIIMQEDKLVPEGVYPAECIGMSIINDYAQYDFRILQKDLQNPYVNGMCKVEMNRSSRLVRWALKLTNQDFELGKNLDFEGIIGAHCFIQIRHRESDDRVFANVVNVYSHNDPRYTMQKD